VDVLTDPTNREELRRLLESIADSIQTILARIDQGDPVELAALLESLTELDAEKTAVLEALRSEASQVRRREEERSLRQFVLRALEEIGSPQTAGFLEDYVYATERVVLKARGFGALRRDENRAWRRRPGHRIAYVVPCLDGEGSPVSRWMARSDWDIEERAVVPGVESLWQWVRVRALVNAKRSDGDELGEPLYRRLLERYVAEARASENETIEEGIGSLEAVEAEAAREIERLEKMVSRKRADVAKRLRQLDPEQALWGATDGLLPAGRISERGERSRSGGDPAH
jgi:hypothetical protein